MYDTTSLFYLFFHRKWKVIIKFFDFLVHDLEVFMNNFIWSVFRAIIYDRRAFQKELKKWLRVI